MGLIRKKGALIVGNVRQSQIITTFGIGSMVDFVNQTVMISGTDTWDWWKDESFRIHNANLENLLNVKYFVLPKASQNEATWEKKTNDLPATIFPKVLYNPSCKTLEVAGKSDCRLKGSKYVCYCEHCGGKSQYLPSRFVLVCPQGHIEDFPYHWWVHEAQGKTCTSEKPKLRMYYAGNKTDMDSLYVECSCGAKRSMKGASARNAFAGYRCSGNRPWLGDHENCSAHEEKMYMQMRIRNESSVYFPCTVSALTIPSCGESRLVEKIKENIDKYESSLGPVAESDKPRLIATIHKTFPNVDQGTIESLMNKMLRHGDGEAKTMQSIIEDEYEAIVSGAVQENNSIFLSHEEDVPEDYNHIIEKIIAIDRLTVVTAMVGFKRLTAPTGYNDPNMVPISKTKKEWYPGIEQRGEGVFIKFNRDLLNKWINKYGTRYDLMGERLNESFFENERFSAQYVFLHTFAHLFIRELSNMCGYSIASIKERIYSTYKMGKKTMAGVLVYTSTPDSDGSLGGLIEQAQKINMDRLLKSMIERGKWCGSDPICYTSKEQGFMSLNYAACHSCALLPETSCEFRNVLLDRCSVCGMPGNEDLGLMNWDK